MGLRYLACSAAAGWSVPRIHACVAHSKVYKSFAARRIAVKMEMKLIAGVICIMIVLPALEYTSPMDVANPMLRTWWLDDPRAGTVLMYQQPCVRPLCMQS